ncbi:ribosomal protein S18-alanine N-acetyltransferase [Hyphomicrobium sp.]|uniref:ribosomal protein S18-alanine N-acetyltransferase n=1 Tax=Hyphomicrobium sp. TaxID=82 RepID=UPI0025C2B081|nr:ribosomal protein S18-alanine N-acetyltransferase [Hyphomicrobium sp.]MCC7252239.1 ribosomal protein S18-alanine N-acetyltransferase [Hyphomicrobium sp.]
MTDAAPFDARYVSLLWAGPEHAAEIARLHGELFSPAWSEESVKALLDHPASTAFMAMVGGAPKTCVGFVLAQLAADEAEILTIGVAKDWQRKGIGRRLVEGVARAAQRAEAKKLYLEVAADNDAAMELYRRAGFLGTGLRRGYYARPGGAAVDAVTFALKL